MLTKKISAREWVDNTYTGGIDHRNFYLKDRKDIYKYREQFVANDMTVEIFYTILEINCNPDFDW